MGLPLLFILRPGLANTSPRGNQPYRDTQNTHRLLSTAEPKPKGGSLKEAVPTLAGDSYRSEQELALVSVMATQLISQNVNNRSTDM